MKNAESQRLFSERLRWRRSEIGITREQLAERCSDRHEPVSISTIRDMEGPEYVLPARRSNYGRTPIEIIADVLNVPLGYLLGGFTAGQLNKSCFSEQIASRKILLTHSLQDLSKNVSFRDFVSSLPYDERGLRELPLYHYRNERAFAVIFRFEKIYCGREILLVNEPPLIFWDEQDVVLWMSNMGLSDADAIAFGAEFQNYKSFFRSLTTQGKKSYQVVLNRQRLREWLKRKPIEAARRLVADLLEFSKLPLFSLALLTPDMSMPNLMRDETSFNESEVISKHVVMPESLDDTIAVQIMQTPPDSPRVEYFVAPMYEFKTYLQREKARIEEAWARAMDQMEIKLGQQLKDSASRTAAFSQLLRQLLEEDCG